MGGGLGESRPSPGGQLDDRSALDHNQVLWLLSAQDTHQPHLRRGVNTRILSAQGEARIKANFRKLLPVTLDFMTSPIRIQGPLARNSDSDFQSTEARWLQHLHQERAIRREEPDPRGTAAPTQPSPSEIDLHPAGPFPSPGPAAPGLRPRAAN
ncbi:unnamed protein product [Rangifer tarandus platyrhynchus]|uniref:Uncharacterized protein n=1 Tax=Rangifer tarandus platyrhynchus TaxID=3082113 RepID=A0ABN8ZYP2_RANTA|nr:unnamed protein product [Rangifer tarandus platyrhynchus]